MKTFARLVFNPTSPVRSPELRYLRTVIFRKYPFSTTLICNFLIKKRQQTGKPLHKPFRFILESNQHHKINRSRFSLTALFGLYQGNFSYRHLLAHVLPLDDCFYRQDLNLHLKRGNEGFLYYDTRYFKVLKKRGKRRKDRHAPDPYFYSGNCTCS